MAKNTNRDYLVVIDVKSSNIIEQDSMNFYINDNESYNIFVNLVVEDTRDPMGKYVPVDDASKYTVTMNIVKPTNEYERIEAELVNVEDALYLINLPNSCTKYIGAYKCEVETHYETRITTSNKFKYRVKASVLNDLDNVVEAPEYPIVVQLFDKLSDINQYEEDRRAAELARQIAEQQRQETFNKLKDAMQIETDEIREAIAGQNIRLDTVEGRLDNIGSEITDTMQPQINSLSTRIDNVEAVNNTQNTRLDTAEGRLDVAENRLDNIGNDITNTMQPVLNDLSSRIEVVEAVNVEQNSRLDAIEVKNQQQDDRLANAEAVNKRQDIDIKCLYNLHAVDITEEGNSVYLQNSAEGKATINEIQGQTLVNCNKEADKELILNGNINTSGYGNVTLDAGVDGGLVDVALEGNTMVNVCDQKDPVAITKSYTVETGNHVALQGEYDGKCRPVVTGNTLVNLYDISYTRVDGQCVISDNKITCTTTTNKWSNFFNNNKDIFKPSTNYTIIVDVSKNTLTSGSTVYITSQANGSNRDIFDNSAQPFMISGGITGLFKKVMTTLDSFDNSSYALRSYISNNSSTEGNELELSIIILEGNYTNKPIPKYFTGLQSSFEDKVVTQEMVDAGEELAENLDKYKVEVKVVGKNLFNGKMELGGLDNKTGEEIPSTTIVRSDFIKVPEKAKFSRKVANDYIGLRFYDGNKKIISSLACNATQCSIDIPNMKYMRFLSVDGVVENEYQIEEGDTATSYEPYKEYTKTFYLNSPLLERDTIEQQGDNVVHVHRGELRAYQTDDELTLPTDKTNTLVAKATPTYEVILQNDTILCDSYVNGHLDVDSAVPIEKVDFLHFEEDLTYLYANTQYTVQFVSDKAVTVDITLGGTKLLAQSIVVGLNKVAITTPETLADNKLIINGVGANISEVVVTQATDQDFGYFEGMKSVGEGNVVEILSQSNLANISTDGTGNFPVANIKSGVTYSIKSTRSDTNIRYNLMLNGINGMKIKSYIINDFCTFVSPADGVLFFNAYSASTIVSDIILVQGVYTSDTMPQFKPYTSNTQQLPHEPLRGVGNVKDRYVLIDGKWYIERNCGVRAYQEGDIDNYITDMINTVYLLASPTYEPIDYNPFTVYSGTTHISNNSTIPCNMTIKNTGYNCILKPSTTYTVSSNLGLNTVTTPSTLTEDCLRFYDTDTSDVTTMRDVMVLEGDYTTGKPLPSMFSGMESAFEQEYDEAVGKYKVKIRVQNEDATKENFIEFYINEPLRGIGDVKDKVYVKDDKVVVERNCGQREYRDGDLDNYLTDMVRTVYPLASPAYEEVDFSNSELSLPIFNSSTIFFNNNVPVTSTIKYTYSTPLTTAVLTMGDVSDQQDALIIDLATQVAVLEMTT